MKTQDGRVPPEPGCEPTASAAQAGVFAESHPSRGTVAILYGYVEEVYNKRGLRTVHFEAIYPYQHRVSIAVVGDPGAEDDNSLTAALYPFCSGLVSIVADVDEEGDLSAMPSNFAAVPCDSEGIAEPRSTP